MPKSKLAALSLVEVLVVLAIVATSMVYVAAINARAQLTVKDDETLDKANGIMIQALELAKSPTTIDIKSSTGNPVTNFAGYYSFQLPTTGQNNAQLIKQVTATQTMTSCDNNSPFLVQFSSASNSPFCLQVTIAQKTRPLTNQTYYEIQSLVMFSLSTGPVSNSLTAYRRGDFQ